MNEKSSFFIYCQEMNSLIKYEYSNKHYMYKISLLILNDYKLDFNKTINKYFFIIDIKYNDYAIINLNSEIITLFIFSLLG